jgi:hypothetical protein
MTGAFGVASCAFRVPISGMPDGELIRAAFDWTLSMSLESACSPRSSEFGASLSLTAIGKARPRNWYSRRTEQGPTEAC